MKSQIKYKKNRSMLLILTLNKFITINYYLIYYKRKIINNHQKIVSLHVVLPL